MTGNLKREALRTISIPGSVKELVDQEVASGAFPSAEDYIRALIEADQKRNAPDRFEELILEGLDSPLSEMTQRDWDDIRREGLAQNPQQIQIRMSIRVLKHRAATRDLLEHLDYKSMDNQAPALRFLPAAGSSFRDLALLSAIQRSGGNRESLARGPRS